MFAPAHSVSRSRKSTKPTASTYSKYGRNRCRSRMCCAVVSCAYGSRCWPNRLNASPCISMHGCEPSSVRRRCVPERGVETMANFVYCFCAVATSSGRLPPSHLLCSACATWARMSSNIPGERSARARRGASASSPRSPVRLQFFPPARYSCTNATMADARSWPTAYSSISLRMRVASSLSPQDIHEDHQDAGTCPVVSVICTVLDARTGEWERPGALPAWRVERRGTGLAAGRGGGPDHRCRRFAHVKAGHCA